MTTSYSWYIFPKTTPECTRLLKMVREGIESNIFDNRKRESALVALKRLRKKRCTKALEYIMQLSCSSNPFDLFSKEVFDLTSRYLDELS